MERGEGRNRSEVPALDARLRALEEALDRSGTCCDHALLFSAAAYAWSLFYRLQAEVYERRLGMPKGDLEVFTILQRGGMIDLVEGRRLRQFCEARFLATRDLAKIDIAGIREMIADRGWIGEILGRFR